MENGSTVPVQGREILDAAALARTLARLAHELIERNDDVASSRSSASTRAASRWRAALRRSSRSEAGSSRRSARVDISFHRDDVLVRGGARRSTPSRSSAATELDFPLEGCTCVLVDDVLYTGRTIRAAIEALFDYGRPTASSWRCSSTAGTASCRSDPTTSARTCRPRSTSACTSQLEEIDGADRVLLEHVPEAGHDRAAPARHLLGVARPDPIADAARVLDTARALERTLDREMKKLPTLRGRSS